LQNIDGLPTAFDGEKFKHSLDVLANDFLLGRDNSLCASDSVKIVNAELLSN